MSYSVRSVRPAANLIEEAHARALYEGIEKNVKCPISGETVNDPVVIDSGFSYERNEIQKWRKDTCPDSQIKYTQSIPNNALKSIVKELASRKLSSAYNLDPFEAFCYKYSTDVMKTPIIIDCYGNTCDKTVLDKIQTFQTPYFRNLAVQSCIQLWEQVKTKYDKTIASSIQSTLQSTNSNLNIEVKNKKNSAFGVEINSSLVSLSRLGQV